ncbi:MAG TPA: right-handed parallel beta-helix repeat-containing protein, partial [Candidatus Sumerlaeota bacterium]|nr:right-handed parallel beta-helix repeat-containing protein [Candidatus Sumerlaeota bacterium]
LIANNMIALQKNSGIQVRDESASRIAHNTLYRNLNGITLMNASPQIINNICQRNSQYGIVESYPSVNPGLLNNCLYGNLKGNYLDGGTTVSWTTQDFDLIRNGASPVAGNFAEDPRLADTASRDYRIRPDSPCIGAGTYLYYVKTDFEGHTRSETAPDVGADEVLNEIHYPFETDSEGWIFVYVPGFATAPAQSAVGGSLMLRSVDRNTYGFWESPRTVIPTYENMLYRGIWSISTDVANQSLVPGMRIRFNEADFQMSTDLLISSNSDGAASPAPGGTLYETYYRPLQGSSKKKQKADYMLAAFDLVNLGGEDQADGALFLEDLMIEAIGLAGIEDNFTTEAVYTFDSGKEGWTLGSAGDPNFADDAIDVSGQGYLGLKCASSRTFGFWQGPVISITPGRVYRMRSHLACSTEDRSKAPQVRMRMNMVNNQAGTVTLVDSNGDGDSSPVPDEWTPYELYCVPPDSAAADGASVAIDIVNFNANDDASGAIYIDRVEIHSAPLPVF